MEVVAGTHWNGCWEARLGAPRARVHILLHAWPTEELRKRRSLYVFRGIACILESRVLADSGVTFFVCSLLSEPGPDLEPLQPSPGPALPAAPHR